MSKFLYLHLVQEVRSDQTMRWAGEQGSKRVPAARGVVCTVPHEQRIVGGRMHGHLVRTRLSDCGVGWLRRLRLPCWIPWAFPWSPSSLGQDAQGLEFLDVPR